MGFEREYIDFGRVTFTSCSVSVWSNQHHAKGLPNVPQRVINAYWQGNHIVVETDSGWVYIYEGFQNYSSSWHK